MATSLDNLTLSRYKRTNKGLRLALIVNLYLQMGGAEGVTWVSTASRPREPGPFR